MALFVLRLQVKGRPTFTKNRVFRCLLVQCPSLLLSLGSDLDTEACSWLYSTLIQMPLWLRINRVSLVLGVVLIHLLAICELLVNLGILHHNLSGFYDMHFHVLSRELLAQIWLCQHDPILFGFQGRIKAWRRGCTHYFHSKLNQALWVALLLSVLVCWDAWGDLGHRSWLFVLGYVGVSWNLGLLLNHSFIWALDIFCWLFVDILV